MSYETSHNRVISHISYHTNQHYSTLYVAECLQTPYETCVKKTKTGGLAKETLTRLGAPIEQQLDYYLTVVPPSHTQCRTIPSSCVDVGTLVK